MLPTFVIGLREGLEAALIVSIIATFLKRNNQPLRPMWIGVCAGILLSIGVGVGLEVLSSSLPQRQQEGLETIVGAVAIVFVTMMIVWMRHHAASLKSELEHAAADALNTGTTTALAVMAFLAVVREGFETAVFLLATIESASSGPAALAGAILGIVVAVGLGYGIYAGGVRLNLRRFFTVTGVFLVFIAAGLVMSTLRTAHEAGWVLVGQASTVDMGWLAPATSVRSALVTGVFGIQTQPRAIELLGWFLYVVPMLGYMFWPARWRPTGAAAVRLRLVLAGTATVVAGVLFAAVSYPQAEVASTAPLTGGGTASVEVGSDAATLVVDQQRIDLTPAADASTVAGARTWTGAPSEADQPATLTFSDLVTLNGGRIPSGLSQSGATGPFDATWLGSFTVQATTVGDGLLDAAEVGTVSVEYAGGGLTTPRVISIDGWQVDPDHVRTQTAAVNDAETRRLELKLWKVWFPAFLLIVAAWQISRAMAGRRSRPQSSEPVVAPAQTPKGKLNVHS